MLSDLFTCTLPSKSRRPWMIPHQTRSRHKGEILRRCSVTNMHQFPWILVKYLHSLGTVGRVLNAWFNDCVVGKSGQSTNSIIANVDPIPYISICARLCLWIYYCERRKNSQFAINGQKKCWWYFFFTVQLPQLIMTRVLYHGCWMQVHAGFRL